MNHWRIIALLIVIASAVHISGCKQSSKQHTAAEVRVAFAEIMQNGLDIGTTHIEADRFDPATQLLHGVRVTAEYGLVSAESAELNVDFVTRTMRLILNDVVVANAPRHVDPRGNSIFAQLSGGVKLEKESGGASDAPEDGPVTWYKTLRLDPIPIGDYILPDGT